jgi:hypothetical protein
MLHIPDLLAVESVSDEYYAYLGRQRIHRAELIAHSVVGLAFTAFAQEKDRNFCFIGTSYLTAVNHQPHQTIVEGAFQPRSGDPRMYRRVLGIDNFMTPEIDASSGVYKQNGFYFADTDPLFDSELERFISLALV